MKARIGVYKFSSCDGCQLAFLNLGETLLALDELVEISYFAEAGMMDEDTPVDIAFVEGSISTAADRERIRRIRDHSGRLVTMGACATAGGLQALRNLADASAWLADVYATPEVLDSLDQALPVAEFVEVDLELWGCPVDSRQLLAAVRSLLFGVLPPPQREKLCLECKRQQAVCVMVTKGEPCMGPVTRSGCGAICPRFGRACYACYGPAESPNGSALGRRFEGLGLLPEQVARRFLFINSHADAFLEAGQRWMSGHD
ncbi:MAG TPA: sulfhydrogenase subunit delta [Gammaproteobacteria bacterium]|nr:sulfhydrogenase subunit delta [Gammaproteobacteria bacterium]